MSVRTRFAPSPTGYLHVGGARTALYNWLWAKKKGGKFLIRVEDTDQARSTEESLQMMLSDLKWLGLTWDEGPEVLGPHAPYKQSERLAIYKEHAQKLLQSGQAYYCFCTEQELEAKKQIAAAANLPQQYDGTCRKVSLDEANKRLAAGEKAVVRFRVKEVRDYKLQDIVRGEVVFPSSMVGDFVCLRSDGMPVYNFCCVVDDALMQISHVLRAEEHLPNTLRQLMLYDAFGYALPQFGHLSLILGEDRQKLSKRHGATSCNEFSKRGYLPEALNNFLALLGWSSPKGDEIMSMQQMVEQFDLTRFTPSGAVFDEAKFKWMNAMHLRALDHKELWRRLVPYLNEAGIETTKGIWLDERWQDRALTAFKTYMELLVDGIPFFKLMSDEHFQLTEQAQEALGWESTAKLIQTWIAELGSMNCDFLTAEEFDVVQNKVKDIAQVKGKHLFMPIRVCVIGAPHGTDLKLLIPLIPRQSLMGRAEKVLNGLLKHRL